MIKRLVEYFRKRKEMRLRKWCIKLAIKVGNSHPDYVYYTANNIYKWIKGLPESEP